MLRANNPLMSHETDFANKEPVPFLVTLCVCILVLPSSPSLTCCVAILHVHAEFPFDLKCSVYGKGRTICP